MTDERFGGLNEKYALHRWREFYMIKLTPEEQAQEDADELAWLEKNCRRVDEVEEES